MTKKRGYKLALIGLILGIIIGLCILAVKNYIANQLIALLDEEAQASCPCEFKVDDVDISLLTLRATAKNARIEAEGEARLFFKKVRASFSLRHIFDHKVFLDHLELIEGWSDGVLEDSPTFQFIDYLSEPIPPEKDHPDRIKIKLEKLSVRDSTFTETLPFIKLAGNGVSLSMVRNEDDNFVLRPFIEQFQIIKKAKNKGESEESYNFGRLTSSLLIKDGNIEFDKLLMSLGQAWLEMDALVNTASGNRIDGSFKYDIDANSIALPNSIQARITGEGQVKGNLANPILEGKLITLKDNPNVLKLGDVEILNFDTIDGAYTFNVFQPAFSFKALSASGPGSSLKSLIPFSLKDDKLSGAFDIKLASLDYANIHAEDIVAQVTLSGPLDALETKAKGEIKKLQIGNKEIPNLEYSASKQSEVLELSLFHKSTDFGFFSAEAKILLDQEKIEESSFSFNDFALRPSLFDESSDDLAALARISGSGSLNGPLKADQLKGSTSLRISSAHFAGEAALQGSASVENGVYSINVSNESKSISAQATLNFKENAKSQLKLVLNDFKAKEYNPKLKCINLSLSSDYAFNVNDFMKGSGQIDVSKVQLGCAPYNILLASEKALRINAGEIALEDVSFVGQETSLALNGTMGLESGYNLKADGSLYLNSLLGLFPELDDLRGLAQATLSITGPLSEPLTSGIASISEGELAIEAANISANSIKGEIDLEEKVIDIVNLGGVLNGGSFALDGTIYPFEFSRSAFTLSLEDILIEPYNNVSVVFSGDLELNQTEEQRTQLQGLVNIESAQFERNLNLITFIKSIPELLFSRKETQQSYDNLPDIDLDIKLKATRNLVILTTFLGTELKGDVDLNGTLSNPRIEGELQSLSGWLGFKDRRFEITSGRVEIKPEYVEPLIEVISETIVRTRTGDNILTILEASGPLTDPIITLSSDRGLSQKEILNLITSFGDISDGKKVGRIDFDEPLLEDIQDIDLQTFLKRLATIEALSIEPTFNSRRGQIEPAIIARKKIFQDLSVEGRSFLENEEQDASIYLQYNLTPLVTLLGSAESSSTEEQTALGIDVAYTILSSKKPFIDISVNGNNAYSELKILKAANLKDSSRIPYNEVDKVAESIEKFYKSKSYFDASVQTTCSAKEALCRSMSLDIKEGAQSRIAKIDIIEEPETKTFSKEKIEDLSLNAVATEKQLQELIDYITNRLRSEGYIGARVLADYKDIADDPKAKQLVISVNPAKPVSFTFHGNKAFSAEDFLETINLFTRKQPFGNNTINILVKNIERKYREAGYIFAIVQYEKLIDDNSDRIHYIIDIEEENKVEVAAVLFKGNKRLPKEKLKKLIEAYDDGYYFDEIFHPTYAIAEQIDNNVKIISNIYIEEGFPNVEVGYQIYSLESSDDIQIKYIIDEANEFTAKHIEVNGIPSGVDLPPYPALPYSIPKVNRYINEVLNYLKESGYRSSNLWSEFDQDSSTFIIHIEAGPCTRIKAIKVVGNHVIREHVIREVLELKPGDAWNLEAIRASRIKLLKLGIFSRIEIEARDGDLDSDEEDLVVRVTEKALQNLQIGGGVNTEYGLHIFGEATDKSLFKDGKSLSLRLDTYYDDTQAEVSRGVANLRYSDPNLFSTAYILTEDLRYQKLELSTFEFDLDRISFSSNLSRSWDNNFSHSIGHTILQENLDNVSPDAVLSELDTGTLNLSFLSGVFRYDKRDNPLNPRSGYSLSLDYALATEMLASDADYYSFGSRFTFLQPVHILKEDFTIALNTRASSAWTFSDTPAIPISQRYYLGGKNSIRGFRENSLGPRGENDSIIGGDLLIASNIEFRYHFQETLALHLFFDAGNVFLKDDTVDLNDLRRSTGVGIKYLSPIGPIGFDIGHPLDEKPGEPSLRLHFGIGGSF